MVAFGGDTKAHRPLFIDGGITFRTSSCDGIATSSFYKVSRPFFSTFSLPSSHIKPLVQIVQMSEHTYMRSDEFAACAHVSLKLKVLFANPQQQDEGEKKNESEEASASSNS